ncbi:DNA polymerase III subunit alpha [Alkalibacterium kapii]|uniref:DNA-directed DNA polymerase n=1 Tax=Alkalibacterium kapii TaxID=426704 RepID=A0A511ARZ8_9LACT|nr:DNA polymerase III subunit alpha [Alkalibacterium kapii]GEK90968.1 DNA-directed DNA polymerase [Alkalibacterium kapii]
MNFVPLHTISAYSLLESTLTIPRLVSKAKELGYKSLALTDNEVMHGAVEFYSEAKNQGIKPIIGITVHIYLDIESDESVPVVLLAENVEGYKKLLALSTQINVHHIKITMDNIKTYTTNTTAIIDFESLSHSVLENTDQLKRILKKISKEIIHTYLGIAYNNQNIEKVNNIKHLSQELSMPTVISEPVNAIEDTSKISLKVLDAIKNQTTIAYDSTEQTVPFYPLKKPDTVIRKYKKINLEDALNNTVNISESINLELEWERTLPQFETPNEMSSAEYLKETVYAYLQDKLPDRSEKYDKRIEKELSTIIKMGFADYFLIVWDLMKYAHQREIVTGSGRGSAAGSLVSYVLNITDVDPIAYDLLFDRFLNEERHTMPDIDLDFPDDKRDRILTYVLKKYGEEHVAQIATFGTFAAKMAVRDTGRVFGLSTDQQKKWADAIPSTLGITLKKAYHVSEKLRILVNENDKHKMLFKTAIDIEGLPRHVSTHAAGVVISKKPLIETVPLQEGNGAMSLTQYAMNAVEKVGLLKMDFLGLKNLSILADCLKNVRELKGTVKEKLAAIPLDDPATLDLFRKGKTNGVFQFESSGIRNVLRKLKPTTFEDIVAVNALYRPGPMEQIDGYIRRKNGQETVDYIHEDLKEILKVTNGVMIYQEQVMKVAQKIAGYSLVEADILRRAISKKIKKEIDAGRKHFVAGAKRNGYDEETALQIYAHIERFADYGFNRSHAVSYSKLAFQLAYFKANHPAAFYVSLMRASSNNKDKLKTYLLEAKQDHIEVMHPSINESEANFKVENGKIIFGLNTIKGLRKDYIQHILSVRNKFGTFKDLLSFVSSIDERWRKERYILPLIQAGSFDQLKYNRHTLTEALESILSSVSMSNGNIELFESLAPKIQLKDDYSLEERLKQEFEVTGFYLSGHPTEKYLKSLKGITLTFITNANPNKTQSYLVSIENIKKIQTKRGEPMAFLEMTDVSGEATGVLFPDNYRRYSRIIKKNKLFIVKGKAEFKKNRWNILIDTLIDPETLLTDPKERLYLRFSNLKEQETSFNEVLEILNNNRGNTDVIIYDEAANKKEKLKSKFRFDQNDRAMHSIEKILGKSNVVLR